MKKMKPKNIVWVKDGRTGIDYEAFLLDEAVDEDHCLIQWESNREKKIVRKEDIRSTFDLPKRERRRPATNHVAVAPVKKTLAVPGKKISKVTRPPSSPNSKLSNHCTRAGAARMPNIVTPPLKKKKISRNRILNKNISPTTQKKDGSLFSRDVEEDSDGNMNFDFFPERNGLHSFVIDSDSSSESGSHPDHYAGNDSGSDRNPDNSARNSDNSDVDLDLFPAESGSARNSDNSDSSDVDLDLFPADSGSARNSDNADNSDVDLDLFPAESGSARNSDNADSSDVDLDLFPEKGQAGIEEKEEAYGNADDDDDNNLFPEAESDSQEWGESQRGPFGFFPPTATANTKKYHRIKIPDEAVKSPAKIIVEYETDVSNLFTAFWENRIKVRCLSLTKNTITTTVPKKYEENGIIWTLVCAKSAKTKGMRFDKYSPSNISSVRLFYFAESGHGLKKIKIKNELQKLANWAILAPYKVACRLELLASPSMNFKSSKRPCQFFLHSSQFEFIEERHNLGCGFIPENLLQHLMGSAKCADVVQVRVLGSEVGLLKGILAKTVGISKIQLPPSMLKVGKSLLRSKKKKKKKGVCIEFVCIEFLQSFPSELNKKLGYQLDPRNKDQKYKREKLNPISESKSYWYLFRKFQVPEDELTDYNEQSTKWKRKNHASLIGIADATHTLPEGHVFISGMGTGIDRRVFITKPPCTETDDCLLCPVVSSKPERMSQEHWDMLCNYSFGTIVFATPRSHGSVSLPEQMGSDRDLDGDTYFVCWDERLLSFMQKPPAPQALNLRQDVEDHDPICDIDFLFEEDGKSHKASVAKKDENDKYIVQIEGLGRRTMDRDEILQGREMFKCIVDHKTTGRGCQLQVEYVPYKKEWKHMSKLRLELPNDDVIAEYGREQGLLDTPGWKWAKDLLRPIEIINILSHRGQGNFLEVLSKYDDGSTKWEKLSDVRVDSPEIVSEYAKQKNLVDRSGWEWAKKISTEQEDWFDMAQDVMANIKGLWELNRLTSELHRLHKNRRDPGKQRQHREGAGEGFSDEEYDKPNTLFEISEEDSNYFGKAYRQSLEIHKHGGKVELPSHLSKIFTSGFADIANKYIKFV